MLSSVSQFKLAVRPAVRSFRCDATIPARSKTPARVNIEIDILKQHTGFIVPLVDPDHCSHTYLVRARLALGPFTGHASVPTEWKVSWIACISDRTPGKISLRRRLRAYPFCSHNPYPQA